MRNLRIGMLLMLALAMVSVARAHIDPTKNNKPARPNQPDQSIQFRELCDNAVAQIDQEINNVRARLTTGGDVWWDGDDGRYVVPKPPPGVPEVSSIFAGAVWLGGLDPGGNLKVAAQTYGRSGGNFDFWPGPLTPYDPADPTSSGLTSQDTCARWDRFFVVKGENIGLHLKNFRDAQIAGVAYDPGLIPSDVKAWPGRGNPFFFEEVGFELPNTSQGLAGFWDEDGDGSYNPEFGDYPVIEIRGCVAPQYPDEMTFWIYNDNGNVHAESQGSTPIKMEIQVQAFAYRTNDEINNMTFQRYKLINRATEDIKETYFAMWADPDLGCYTDDYIGCDTTRSLAYVYNVDALDGTNGCSCDQGVNTYCEDVPILGLDYFRGPRDEFDQEIGMSSFTYSNNASSTPTPPPGTTDAGSAQEYYYYLTGRWRDGSPFTYGGDAYQDGVATRYAFPDAPNSNGWSMCKEALPVGDRRTIQASGPFTLLPGAVNELIVGMVWVADQIYPCPSIRKLQEADDVAQALFDNCFEITRGPDAPDVDFIELDREIIAVFSNDTTGRSNNPYESYAAKGLRIPDGVTDSLYRFEGYKLFQFAGPEVSLSDQDDPAKVRLVYQVDVKNGVSRLFNWKGLSPEDEVTTPTPVEYFVPELQVDAADEGIRHTFRITEDQFAQGDRSLVNHRRYYFVAVAYAYNEYDPFDPADGLGQRFPYLEGDRNIGDGANSFYTVIPRPIVDRTLNAAYGDGVLITRIDGVGVGGNFIDISDESRQKIEQSFGTTTFDGQITYKSGRGPINVSIYNPIEVQDGEFELTMIDENMANQKLDNQVRWVLKNLSVPGSPIIASESTIDRLNEQIVPQYGFSVTIGQTQEIGVDQFGNNGAIGYEEEYKNAEPTRWIRGYKDNLILGAPAGAQLESSMFDYVATDVSSEDDYAIDPLQRLSNIGPGYFIPYYMADWRSRPADFPQPYLTPAWTTQSGNYNNIARGQMKLENTPSVDIVFTSNKDLWSRCVVIETANRFYQEAGFVAQGDRKHFDLRGAPSVTKFDNDGDGRPDPDPNEAVPGMGWFPGYAIDVETGQRLDVFFGENSTYDGTFIPEANNGADMMFNPSAFDFVNPAGGNFASIYNYIAGGQHYVYVSKLPYSECALFKDRLAANPNLTRKVLAVKEIVWAGMIALPAYVQMKSYQDGLIPEDVVVKLRVDNPYQNLKVTDEFNGYPTYRFKIEGKKASPLTVEAVESALDQIRMVPNPYFGFSEYEDSQFENIVKITNLPAKCVVTIYTLDGKFIRQYNRDEVAGDPKGYGVLSPQVAPALEWDLKNSKGIPISSGVYLIHVKAEGLGERTLKWFGVNRNFETNGL